MTIRGWERSTLAAAASVAVVMGLTACGPTSEPAAPETTESGSSSSAEASPKDAEPMPEEEAAESDAPATGSASENNDDGGGGGHSQQPAEGDDAAVDNQEDAQAEAPAESKPDRDDNDPALCDAADLTGSIEEIRGGATAGSVYRGLEVTNTSADPCVLAGFPGVSYVDAGGNQIGTPAARSTSEPAVSIDLQPGESAMATLKQTKAANYGDQCEQVEASGLRVYPPSAYDSLIVQQNIMACADPLIELMTIGSFQPAE
ncbi:DUF4232 domain-containing protein [Arthrobacter monumenti]